MWLTSRWTDTPDGSLHLQRVRALAEALSWGELFPRWFPNFAFGYGHPILNFYAPACYYLPALLRLAGVELVLAVRIGLAIAFALSAIASYALLRCWARPWPAALGTLLFLVFPYRTYDLVVRGALPEFVAFLWLPLVALTTVHALTASRRERPVALLWAALAWAGLILTHNLTALMALLVVGTLCLLALIRVALLRLATSRVGATPPWPHLSTALFSVALGGLLAAPYALPALAEARWVGLGSVASGDGYLRHLASLTELFDLSLAYRYPLAADPLVPVPAIAVVGVLLGAGGWLASREKRKREALAAATLVSALAVWLCSDTSVAVWRTLTPLLGRLMFPWRWQAMLALSSSFALGVGIDALAGAARRYGVRVVVSRLFALAAVVALVASILWAVLGGLNPIVVNQKPALTTEAMWTFDAVNGQIGATWLGEFLPRWVTEQRWAIGRATDEGDGSPSERHVDAEFVTAPEAMVNAIGFTESRIDIRAAQPGRLVLHTFYYPAWEAIADGSVVPTSPLGELGLLAIDLPAGAYPLVVRWARTPAVWLGLALSVLALLLLAVVLARQVTSSRRLAWTAWVLAATTIFAVSGVAPQRVRPTTPVGEDYGAVRLQSAAYWPEAASSGDQVSVQLFWQVQDEPEPLVASVQVVDSDGRLVAQHDQPVGGLYTPPERWWPGQLLADEYRLELPLELAPGTYHVLALLYRPSAPDAPLGGASGLGPDGHRHLGDLVVR